LIEIDINKLTALEIAGQLVMPRIDFNIKGYFEQAVRFVENYHVTGFIIFGGNIDQVKKTTSALQDISKYPLFFGIDAERGLGQIVQGGSRFPFLMSLGATGSEELVELQAVNTAREMKYCGLNLLFAPVLDINTNSSNPIVNIRAFGDEAQLVSRLGSVFYNKIKSEGIFACGKHFPGHGSTDADSHVELPVLYKTAEELLELELVPFIKAIDSGIDFLMVGHLATDKIDNKNIPAIISKTLITKVLRVKLGFKKAVITDSFRMDALKEIDTEDTIAINSLEAGCDIVLDPVNGELLIEKLTETIKDNHDFSSTVKNSIERLFKLKGTIKPPSDNFPDRDRSSELVNRIAKESICFVKGELLNCGKIEVNIFDVMKGGENICIPFLDRLKVNGFDITAVNYITNHYDFKSEGKYDTINIVVTTVSAWTKYSELTSYYKQVLNHISKRQNGKKVLVSFGSPYVIADLLDYNIIISVFEIIEPCQNAAADVLSGKITSNAELPIKF